MKTTVLLHKNPVFFTDLSETEANLDDFDCVATIDAAGPDDAWCQTQNIDDAWNKDRPCRSSAVGDIFVCGTRAWRVDAIGFTEVTLKFKKEPTWSGWPSSPQ